MRQWQDAGMDKGNEGKVYFVLFFVHSIRTCLSACGDDPRVRNNGTRVREWIITRRNPWFGGRGGT